MGATDPPVVLIVGCGIAGPVLALLLKQKGYQPIIFEKVRQLGDAGASLGLMANGLKVLGLLDLHKPIYDHTIALQAFEEKIADGALLASSDFASTFTDRYGYATVGIRRTFLNLLLRDRARSEGIEIREGWGLEDFQLIQDGITASFGENRSVSGAFLVGCDGIRSNSRRVLLAQKGIEEGQPEYTGLIQTAMISPTPRSLSAIPAMRNWYSPTAQHIIAYPISPTHTSWAITSRETTPAPESWKLITPSDLPVLKTKILEQLEGMDEAVREMAANAERATRFGLFDRGALEPSMWSGKRCVLVGDAAHPTSPHLGQGANQALEDCYHLSRLLPVVSKDGNEQLSVDALGQIFETFAELRAPRTQELVKGARAAGEKRIVSGVENGEKRNEDVRTAWKDVRAVEERFDSLLRDHPFIFVPERT